MNDRLRFILNRIGERLWVKPLLMCVVSVVGAFTARAADYVPIGSYVPAIKPGSIDTLLTVISSSMLVIATFAVASMLSAYASASSTATPRSFSLVIADDVSQNALSAFIGAFIFSIVALIAVENDYYDKAGLFILFVLTLVVFAIVIVTFVRWVDQVARLGRLGTTIDKVEAATVTALKRRRRAPTLGGVSLARGRAGAHTVYGQTVGYVQQIDLGALQSLAEKSDTRVEVAALPGTFAAPGRPLAYVAADSGVATDIDGSQVARQFSIGDQRTFDDDPRFGLIALSEIASRALSPGINDPGTAIDVIGTLVRVLAGWGEAIDDEEPEAIKFDRVAMPELSLDDMFDDAFNAIARDGAGTIEVVVRLQKAFESLASIPDDTMQRVARGHARRALERAEMALNFPGDRELARESAAFAASGRDEIAAGG